MSRRTPNTTQNILLPLSLAAVLLCILQDRFRQWQRGEAKKEVKSANGSKQKCVIISGGRMTKGLTLARAFKRAGWKVIGVEEEGWGTLCPLRFSSALSQFYLLPSASRSYAAYTSTLQLIATEHGANLFIPVSGVASSVEDSLAAEEMYAETKGKCFTFIQDPETMRDLHEKDRFMDLVARLGGTVPGGKMVTSVSEAMDFLGKEGTEPRFVLKCMGLDENRGDMTLFPLQGDGADLVKTRKSLEGLKLRINKECPYVFQEFIDGQEYCTHASVISGRITSFVTCPSNDMLMTYENATSSSIGKQAEEWTQNLLDKLSADLTPSGKKRTLTGHFSFDFIHSTKNGVLYPIECNARVHTAVILLPLDGIAACYESTSTPQGKILRPSPTTAPRSWIYNDLIMRYLPKLLPVDWLEWVHPSLPACAVSSEKARKIQPREDASVWRIDPTLVADDPVPFLVLWHVFWPWLLLSRWWQGKKWTRLNVSTGRIFEA